MRAGVGDPGTIPVPDRSDPVERPILQDLVPVPAVWERLGRVETRLVEVTRSESEFLTGLARHLLQAGGKRYRPLLAQVAAELGDGSDAAVEAGVAVELVHLGSLYHDDVIDEAETRRGAPSVNANWNNTVAILAGDFLLARASEVAAPLGEEAVTIIARTYATLCEGQVLELQLSDDLDHGPEDYYRVVGGKTASLIRTSARLGAMAAGAPREAIDAVGEWAWEMGLVFQMTDDVLDLVATEEFLGKPTGSDIGEGVFTLPVLHALAGPDGDEIRRLLGGGRPRGRATVDRVVDLVVAGGHIDRVLDEAAERLRVAEKAAARLPSERVADLLRNLDAYLMERVKAARSR
jgi:heptaprenyl diphosphate synthase